MYDPTVGRFLSEDPIGFDALDPNLARYVGNSPVNFTDPSGLDVGITGDSTHAGIEVDVRDANGKVIGYLRADFYAEGFFGEGGKDPCGSGAAKAGTYGAQGRIMLTFVPGAKAKGNRPVVGTASEDDRLVNWLLAQVGRDRVWFDGEIAAERSEWRLDGVGNWSWYRGISNNCIEFVDRALDVYYGADWYWGGISTNKDLQDALDKKFSRDGTRKPPNYSSQPYP